MKLISDERLKHQLIGFLVMLSLAVIFVPTILKKSNQRFEMQHSMSMRLPPPPDLPQVKVDHEKAVFQHVRVARIDLPPIREERRFAAPASKSQTTEVHAALPMPSKMPSVSHTLPKKALATVVLRSTQQSVVASQYKVPKRVGRAVKSSKVSLSQKEKRYSVQLASFSLRNNALSLVARLKSKGYSAYYLKSSNAHTTVYKVYVGALKEREAANHLRQELSHVIQIQGFVVPLHGIA